MKTAIRKHLGDFLAIVALFVAAMGIAGYILSNERLRFPLVEEKTFPLKVELRTRRRSHRVRARRSAWPASRWARSARWSSRTARRS